MLFHIYNHGYSFGAGRRREIKGILVYLNAGQTGSLDITRFLLLLPIVGLPLGFMLNNGSAERWPDASIHLSYWFYIIEGVFNIAAST